MAYTAFALIAASKPIHAETPETDASGGNTNIVYDVPRVAAKTPDAADWGEGVGFRVDALADPAVGAARRAVVADPSVGAARSAEAAADRFRLGWNEEGLLVYVDVRDSTPFEAESIWNGDSVHVCVGRPGNVRDHLYFLIGPGRAEGFDKPGIHYLRYLPDKMEPYHQPEQRFAVRGTEGGYAVELLVPLALLGVAPAAGVELDVQVMIFDHGFDGARRSPRWAPARIGFEPEAMRRVRLTDGKPSPPVLAAAGCELGCAFPGSLAAGVRVVGDASLAGKAAAVVLDGAKVGECKFGEAKDGFCEGFATVPLPSASKAQGVELEVVLPDGGGRVPAPLGYAFAEQRERFGKLELEFQPWVFAGERFPKCGFKDAALADALSGFDYKIETRFFDADCKPVEKPERAGRYGAVAEVTAFGETRRKFFTLYRVADGQSLDWGLWWRSGLRARLDGMPEGLGVDRRVWEADPAGVVGGDFKFFLREQMDKDGRLASLLAGLSELPEDVAAGVAPPSPRQRPEARHREFLFHLRRAAGENPDYPFLTWTPKAYDKEPERRWPLVVFLHGGGENGSDLSKFRYNGPSAQEWLREDLPFILVTPQCPVGEWWEPTAVAALVDKVCATMRVDAERIYLTGISMGGFGTCAVAASRPELFAAIAPVCGFGSVEDVVWYKDVPVWAFHGAKDTIVPPEGTRKGVSRLKELGSKNVRYTEYPEEGHGITDIVYADHEFWAWLLEQRRKSND